MKKSRIAKLALMGASITALAATLTTSTYAWYVSNKTATVATANGQTAASVADGSILVSWTGADDTWFKELTWSDAGAPSTFTTNTNKLAPVFWDVTNQKFTDMEGDDAAGGYYEFDMYIKADAANTSVTPVIAMQNTTNETTMGTLKQIAYVATGTISKGASFVVDAFDATYYSLSVDDANAVAVAAPAAGKFNAVNTEATLTTAAPAAAHTYYETVTGETIGATYKAAVVTGSISALTVGTTAMKLTWRIWLAGNDVDCYNSCAGQSFSFGLTFNAA